MGKHKESRRTYTILKRNNKHKQVVKVPSVSQVCSLPKHIECRINDELEFAYWSKKGDKSFKNELDSFPLLAKAVYLGCERAVDELLEAGGNVNVQTVDGSTPLMIAVGKGHNAILQKLLRKGADITMTRKNGMNSLMIAVTENEDKAFAILWSHLNKTGLWHLNHSDSAGNTLLTTAVERGNFEYTKFLLGANGLEVDRQTKDGRTALMLAVKSNHKVIVRCLVESGANILLEDWSGATALCFAFANEKMEIAEILQEYLNFKQKDVYVQKRIDLLSKPRQSCHHHDDPFSFYKKILFRVLLKIKKVMHGGIHLLLHHGVFPALIRLADLNRSNGDLQRLIFHVAVCLMYNDNEDVAELVIEEMAGSFVVAGGPDYCVQALLRMAGKERWSALLPVHASCVGCLAGRRWLMENCHRITEYTIGFRAGMPFLKYWTNGEREKADHVLAQFEQVVIQLQTRDNSVARVGRRDSVITYPVEEDAKKWASSDSDDSRLTSVEILAKKSKTQEVNIVKLMDKSHHHNQRTVLDSNRKPKCIYKSEVELSPPFLKVPGNLNPNLFTGYADALKKNLNQQTEGNKLSENVITSHESNENVKLATGEDVEMEDIQLPQNILKSAHQLVDNTSNFTICNSCDKPNQITLATFLLPKCTSDDERMISSEKNCTINILESLHESSKNQSQVFNLHEPSNAFSISTVKSPSSIPQSLNTSSFRSSRENHKTSNIQSNSEAVIFPPDDIRLKAEADDVISSSVSASKNLNVQSKIKLTAEDEDMLCLKFNNLLLNDVLAPEDELVGNKTTLKYERAVDPEQKNNKKTVVSRFLNVTGLTGCDMDFPICSKQGIVLKRDETLSGHQEVYKIPRRSYSDVTRGEDKNGINELNAPNVVYLKHNETKITRNAIDDSRRKYSDVTRVGMEHISEIEENLIEINPKEIHNNMTEAFSHHAKSEVNKTNSYANNFSMKGYLEQSENEMLRDKTEDTNQTRQKMNIWNTDGDGNSQFTQLDIQTNEFDKESALLELASNLQNQSTKQNIPRDFCSILSVKEEIVMSNQKEGVRNTVCQNSQRQTEKSAPVNNIYRKSTYNKLNIEGFTQKFLNLEAVPSTYKWKLGDLQNYSLFFKRTGINFLLSTFLSSESGIINNHFAPYRNLVRSLLLKHGLISKHETSVGISRYVSDNVDANSFGEVHEGRLVGLIEFFKLFFNFVTVKTIRNVDIRQKKQHDSTLEPKRRRVKEEILMHRRIRNSGKSPEYGHPQTRFLNAGYKSEFINCEFGSKWYPVLKNLYSCIPLSHHLLAPESILKGNNATQLRSIDSKAGKVVFGIGLEHTLREGDFGSYVGIVEEDGSPVAIHQMSTSTMFNDITMLYLSGKHLLKHKNLTKFYDAQIDLRDLRMSFIYELCEYSLPQYLKMYNSGQHITVARPSLFLKLLIIDLLEGVHYLHGMEVVHGFLKPTNLVVTIDHRLKLTDYHLLDIMPLTWGTKFLDSKQEPIGSSISKYCWRTTELIKAKNLVDARASLTTASDIQMCGMILFYMLSGGRHPFGSSDHTCQENIKMGTRLMGPHPEDTESRDLVCEMIRGDPSERPSIKDVLKHPYFWDREKRFQFLLRVGKKISFYTSRPNRAGDDFRKSCIEARNWIPSVQRNLMKYISKCANKTFKNEFSDLLQFAVTLQDSFEAMPTSLKNFVRQPSFYMFLTFPTTFMSVYHVIRNCPLLRTQMAVQDFF